MKGIMNVVEFVFIIGFPTCAFVVGRMTGHLFGVTGWCVGAVLGLVLWFLLFRGIRFVFIEMSDFFYKRPTCLRGKCTTEDYRCLRLRKDGAEFICKCGDIYFAAGNRFRHVDKDGSTKPFMVRRHMFAEWKREDQ